MKKLFLILLLLVAKSKSIAQITLIPDYRFERALIDLGIDSDSTINGQILTSDALLVTQLELSSNTLPNYPYPPFDDIYQGMIHDLTGLEAFVNLERLEVHRTLIENLNTDNLINLKYLDCVDNMLTSISVSNNPLLEYIDVTSEGDLYPINDISEIDLSNNPNIQTIFASGLDRINLNNNNNNPNTVINVYCTYCFEKPIDYIHDNICIKVDNLELAENNQAPYSSWTVNHAYIEVNYADELNLCSLRVANFDINNINIYPNPIDSSILYFKVNDNSIINKVIIFDYLGRKLFEQDNVINQIVLTDLQKGNYVLQIFTNNGNQTKKIIVN
jgi:hypothetical protein